MRDTDTQREDHLKRGGEMATCSQRQRWEGCSLAAWNPKDCQLEAARKDPPLAAQREAADTSSSDL